LSGATAAAAAGTLPATSLFVVMDAHIFFWSPAISLLYL